MCTYYSHRKGKVLQPNRNPILQVLSLPNHNPILRTLRLPHHIPILRELSLPNHNPGLQVARSKPCWVTAQNPAQDLDQEAKEAWEADRFGLRAEPLELGFGEATALACAAAICRIFTVHSYMPWIFGPSLQTRKAKTCSHLYAPF